VAVAYDDVITHTTFILIFNQVLYIETMNHNLISPFQIRMNDIVVNDTPLRLLITKKDLNEIDENEHSIITNDPLLKITLRLRGTVSYFNTRKPTKRELEDVSNYPRIIMTYESPEWNPHDESLSVEEEKLREQITSIPEIPIKRDRAIASLDTLSLISGAFGRNISALMQNQVYISEAKETKTRRRKGTVQVEELAKRWHVSLEIARKTIENTTQKGVRDYTNMAGTRRLRHLTQQLQYRPLKAFVILIQCFQKYLPYLTNILVLKFIVQTLIGQECIQ
jgi:hypothetical protein